MAADFVIWPDMMRDDPSHDLLRGQSPLVEETSPGRQSRPADRELHERLLAGDPTAPFDLIEGYLEPLTGWLCARLPGMDRRDLEEIAFDSVSRLAQEPARYDPARATLTTYLHVDAKGDAINAWHRAKQQAAREISLEAVELSSPTRNSLVAEDPDPADRIAGQEDARMARAWVDENFAGIDREVVWLMFAGERHTAVFASVLGHGGLRRVWRPAFGCYETSPSACSTETSSGSGSCQSHSMGSRSPDSVGLSYSPWAPPSANAYRPSKPSR